MAQYSVPAAACVIPLIIHNPENCNPAGTYLHKHQVQSYQQMHQNDVNDVVVGPLLLTLNSYWRSLWYFHYWCWICKHWMGRKILLTLHIMQSKHEGGRNKTIYITNGSSEVNKAGLDILKSSTKWVELNNLLCFPASLYTEKQSIDLLSVIIRI